MNYSNYIAAGFAMSPTYIVFALATSNWSTASWLAIMVGVLFIAGVIYDHVVLRAIRRGRNPRLSYWGLIVGQFFLYGFVSLVWMQL